MYGHTYRDRGITSPEIAWKMLRALRSSPPGLAASPDRKATFGAALEQAEQLFRAATTVAPTASPLLVFYGLSQAGRAVAAANATGEEWRLKGHGITNSSTSDVTPDKLAYLTARNQSSGAFVQLADILNVGSLPQPVRIGDLWCLIPGADRFPLPHMGDRAPLKVTPESGGLVRNLTQLRARVRPVPVSFPQPAGQLSNWDELRHEIAEFVNLYPSLAGWSFGSPEGQPPSLRPIGPGLFEVSLVWNRSNNDIDEEDQIDALTVGYGADRLAFPFVGADNRATHPFLIWWVLLYVLSKLTRYEPESWMNLISVDASTAATAIEHLLRNGLTVLPEVIHRTILEVSNER